MLDRLNSFLTMTGLPPHGYCLLWDPWLVGTHVTADAFIALAYFSIPFALLRLIKARPDIGFGWMLGLFATFILACGATHLISVYVLWVPAYGVEAAIKIVTALASVATAALLIPLIPKLVALPSPAQMRAVNERLLVESGEREKTSAMLRESQKLEAIGRLTGGVAHDFNNLLHVVIGNIERARRSTGPQDAALDAMLGQAMAGAERAAELTDQLLTFARRQDLEYKSLDLEDVIGEACPLIERAIGNGVVLTVDHDVTIGPVRADRNQLLNALLNLSINASHAMPKGGKLMISTHSNGPDEPVELRVTDTGGGMAAETLERATEPFFTTRSVGEGTGLGLSQVYGMVEQLGGSMKLESRLGVGTSIRLFLPRSPVLFAGKV